MPVSPVISTLISLHRCLGHHVQSGVDLGAVADHIYPSQDPHSIGNNSGFLFLAVLQGPDNRRGARPGSRTIWRSNPRRRNGKDLLGRSGIVDMSNQLKLGVPSRKRCLPSLAGPRNRQDIFLFRFGIHRQQINRLVIDDDIVDHPEPAALTSLIIRGGDAGFINPLRESGDNGPYQMTRL